MRLSNLYSWLPKSLSGERAGRSPSLRGRPPRAAAKPRLESFDDRCLPAIIYVGNTGDIVNIPLNTTADQLAMMPHNDITLREAIIAANNSATPTTITFEQLPTNSVIKPTSALPAVTADNVVIDTGDPRIGLDGSLAPNTDGLVIMGDDCQVIKLYAGHFGKAALVLSGAGDEVEESTIGVDVFGNFAANGVGISVSGATGAAIKGVKVSHSKGAGIDVRYSTGVTIQGSTTVNNDGDGLRIAGGARGDGFTTEVTQLVTDANGKAGIHIVDSSFNKIGLPEYKAFNWIGGGNNYAGVGNKGDGLRIESTDRHTSAGNSIAYNYIGGNQQNGVSLVGAGTHDNTLTKNRIGMTALDIADIHKVVPVVLGNRADGVAVTGGAHDNAIGGPGLFTLTDEPGGVSAAGDGNVIVANGGDGVRLAGGGVDSNVVRGNIIGTVGGQTTTFVNADTSAVDITSNEGDGIRIDQGASNNRIGGTGGVKPSTGEGNLISGNVGAGVTIRGGGTADNRVQGNRIGTNLDGSASLFDSVGVVIESGAANNVVGGVAGADGEGQLGNLISGNTRAGVMLGGAGTTGNRVQGNKIGTDRLGQTAVPNGHDGVLISAGAAGNLIGGQGGEPTSLFTPGNLISGNKRNGIRITGQGTTANRVEGNRIGTDAGTLNPVANAWNGVFVGKTATTNFVGGSTDRGNVISGNSKAGVLFEADGNYLYGNRIGITANGLSAVPNTGDGVQLLSSGNAVALNVVSGNGSNGVYVIGSNNVLLGNKIGTDATGNGALGNARDGILMHVAVGPGGNWIGSGYANTGNLISGNGANGIEANGPASAGNLIQGNLIGTNAGGGGAVANALHGVFVDDTSGYVVGGHNPGEGNLISGNAGDGVVLSGVHSTGIQVLGNKIGTTLNGKLIVSNSGQGIHLLQGANLNRIGGTGPADGNLISANGLNGVLVEAPRSKGNSVLGNRIGTDADGLYALSNLGNGVAVVSGTPTGIGAAGGTVIAGNLISGNRADGVRLDGAGATVVTGNLIGTNADGSKAIPNEGNGLELVDVVKAQIGGANNDPAQLLGNVISGNIGAGVLIRGGGSNVLEGNFIGTTKAGNAPLGNDDGVAVREGSAANRIGGAGAAGQGRPGNVISGNRGNGVLLRGSQTKGNLVQGNAIGTSASGAPDLGNGANGVYALLGASDNLIGGLAAGAGNAIAYNHLAGVAVGLTTMDISTAGNGILSNRIYDNGGLGIDLGGDGVTPNGPNFGPNQLQHTPVLSNVKVVGGVLMFDLYLKSTPKTAFTIQIFANPAPDGSGYGEGRTLVATITVNTDGNGVFSGTVPLSVSPPFGQYLAATATDPLNNTSEFSRAVPVPG